MDVQEDVDGMEGKLMESIRPHSKTHCQFGILGIRLYYE